MASMLFLTTTIGGVVNKNNTSDCVPSLFSERSDSLTDDLERLVEPDILIDAVDGTGFRAAWGSGPLYNLQSRIQRIGCRDK